MDAAKTAQETFELERKDLEKRFGAACAERDKAVRDLKRLKQHLIEKVNSDFPFHALSCWSFCYVIYILKFWRCFVISSK